MRPLPKILANLSKTAGASALQFLITLITTPLMTRLYEPAAYATFGIANGIATTLVSIGLLSLPVALAGEKDASHRAELIRTMLVMLLALGALSCAAAMVVASSTAIHHHLHVPISVLLLIPLLVLTYGARCILMNLMIERGNFSRIAFVQVAEPLCSRGGSIALGATLGGHPALILLSVVLGQLLAIRLFLKQVIAFIREHWRMFFVPLSTLRTTFRRYAHFIYYSTATNQLQGVALLLYQSMIVWYCSKEIGGQFMLAFSMLTLPANMIALATAPVTYHHFSELIQTRPHRLLSHFLLLTALYALGATAIFLPLYYFGEPLFRLIFGASWAYSGTIATALSLSQAGFFVVVGLQSIFMATRNLKRQFMLEALLTLPTLALAAYSFHHYPFASALMMLTIAWCMRHTVMLVAGLYSAATFSKQAAA